MYRAVSATAGPRRYNVEPITDNQSVHWALLHSYARDPEYVKAVLRSYIEVKKSRGRLSNDISLKLNYLEQQVPQYAESFHAVRAEYRLPPSRVLPSSTITPLSPTISRLSSQQRRSPPRSPRRSTERRTSTSSAALPPEFQVRPAPAPEDELPPPPYARQDPEPDSTRLLQERLAAEASANLPPDTRLVFPTSPRRASHAGTGISRPTSQMGQGSTAGDSPARRSTQTPPTTSSPANENRSRRSSNRPISPPHPPEDDEIARAYEENALEEAKRASILAEQERKELEEAMSLSLAEPMPEAGPSQWESLAPTRTPGPRRVVSDISGSSFTAGPSRPGPSLLDSDDQMEGFKPLVPQKTGAVMQSRNPFLSASENTTPPRDQAGSSRTLFTGRALPPLPVSSQLHPAQQAELPEKQRHDMGLIPEYPSQPEQSSSHLPVQATLEPPHISDNTDLFSADNQNTAQQDGGDPLHSLSYYSTVFLIDDAPSMAGEPWNKAKSAFTQVAETAMKYAEDGIDVYFTNSKRVGRELKTSDDIEELLSGLQARGAGSIGYRLQTILREYMERLTTIDSMSPGRQRREVKPMILIVVTDGACALQMVQRKNQQEYSVPRPDMLDHSAEDDLESVIVACARELDNAQHPASQIGIQFLQIGNNTEAREALEHLDNGIAELHGVRDMVDMVVYDQDGMPVELIRKTLFGGIDRNWDNYNV